MNGELKETFSGLWEEYFNGTEFPIAFYYTDQGDEVEVVKPPSGRQCIMAVLSKVQKGTSLCFEAKSIGCPGGKKYLGYSKDVMPNFEYFLSCGIPGKLKGERYKKYVHGETLTFAVPMNRFAQMIENMPESFLVTPTWRMVKTRLEGNKGIIS